jgi:hypothetical protein
MSPRRVLLDAHDRAVLGEIADDYYHAADQADRDPQGLEDKAWRVRAICDSYDEAAELDQDAP